jgi:hypothetical protein
MMVPLLIAVTTLSLVVLQTNAANLTVGSCVTIDSDKYPGRFLYDSGSGGQYWVYTTSSPTHSTHKWRVKSNNGNILKFENVQHPARCLCERYSFLWMYAATCECKDTDPAQNWQLEEVDGTVRFKRPNGNRYYLKDCPNTSCAYVSSKVGKWNLKNVDC